MRLRDLFRGPSNAERKSTVSLSAASFLPTLDASTFVNAAHEKDTDTLHKYLLAGFPPDQPDPSTKATALHAAAEAANLRATQMLLQAGASVNAADLSCSTPLHVAAYLGHEDIVQTLLSHGADMYRQDNTGRNAFHLAISTGNLRLVQHFLVGADAEESILHTPDAQNWTPLMCAAASNHPTICAFLLSHHANLCAINDRHLTVFHIAAFLGSLAVLHELLAPSASHAEVIARALNQGDNRNQTALFYACAEGHLDVALALLRAGANAYHLDNDDQTCLHAMLSTTIVLKRHIRLFYHLIQYVDYRCQHDYLGRTLLDLAHLNQLNTLAYLLSLLHYTTNTEIVFDSDKLDNHVACHKRQVLSLRQLCVLRFKRSIVYHRHRRQASQADLLRRALQETFHIEPEKDATYSKDNHSLEFAIGKSLDDISLLQQQSTKYQKNAKATKHPEKKMRKTSTIFSSASSTSKWSSQIDLQHSHSTWSVLTNKLKGQRTPPTPPSPQSVAANQQSSPSPVPTSDSLRTLAVQMLGSPAKLDELLDFPSLTHSQFLNDDLKTSMNTYNLLDTNALNAP